MTLECGEKEIKRKKSYAKSCKVFIINGAVLCGVGGCDEGRLLALLPVPRQQHCGVRTEVLVDLGK